MGSALFPNDGTLSLAMIASAISETPTALGISEKAYLRGVLTRGHDDQWRAFALQLHIGRIKPTQGGSISANNLVLFEVERSARDLGDAQSLTAFLQSWRELVPKPISRGRFQDRVQVRRQWGDDTRLPCWEFLFYEHTDDPEQNIVPTGGFSNTASDFLASSVGDAAAQWLGDQSANEYSGPQSGIRATVWDARGYVKRLDWDAETVTVRIASKPGLHLNCKAVFRAGSKDPNRETKEVGTLDEIRFAIPKGAERCEIFLVGVDDFFYDQRLVWLTRTLSASFSVVDEPAKPAKRRSATQRASNKEFIALQRIKELKKTVNPQFDLRILIRLCEELNQSWNGKSLFAVAALTRTILNHVPPLFGKKDFREVAGNGGRSFRASMSHLDKSAKKIADGHMHSTIRQREVLPTANQVDFSRELDVLLGEIVRRLGTVEKPTIS